MARRPLDISVGVAQKFFVLGPFLVGPSSGSPGRPHGAAGWAAVGVVDVRVSSSGAQADNRGCMAAWNSRHQDVHRRRRSACADGSARTASGCLERVLQMPLWCCHDGGESPRTPRCRVVEGVGIDGDSGTDPIERADRTPARHDRGNVAVESRHARSDGTPRGAARSSSLELCERHGGAVVADAAGWRRRRHAAAADARLGSLPVPGQEFVQLMAFGSPETIAPARRPNRPADRVRGAFRVDQRCRMAQLSAPPSLPLNNELRRPIAIGRIERSTVFVSTSTRPSLRTASARPQ